MTLILVLMVNKNINYTITINPYSSLLFLYKSKVTSL